MTGGPKSSGKARHLLAVATDGHGEDVEARVAALQVLQELAEDLDKAEDLRKLDGYAPLVAVTTSEYCAPCSTCASTSPGSVTLPLVPSIEQAAAALQQSQMPERARAASLRHISISSGWVKLGPERRSGVARKELRRLHTDCTP